MSQIKNLIFDFGDVFINLDKAGAMANALDLFEIKLFDETIVSTNIQYEIGAISTEEFINFYRKRFKHLDEDQLICAWNYILKDFPFYRMEFLKQLRSDGDFHLSLLSNTNALHIDFVKETVPFYEEFKSCFDAFYLSHEIHDRKPNATIFEFVLESNNLKPENCLFIDDTSENTVAAERLGIHVWNIDENTQDVVNLFKTKHNLF